MFNLFKLNTFKIWAVMSILFTIIVITSAVRNDIQKERRMWYAIRNGNLTSIKSLIDFVPPNKMIKWQTPVALAAQRTLLHRLFDPFGIYNPYITNLEYFIDMGADPCLVNGEGRTPYEHYMQFVTFYPHPRVKELLDVCDINNIHHYPDYQHCSKYYGDTFQYSLCTEYPYANAPDDFMRHLYL